MVQRSGYLLVVLTLFCLVGAAPAFAAAPVSLDLVVIGGERPVTVTLTDPAGTVQTREIPLDEFRIPVEGGPGVYQLVITAGEVSETAEIEVPSYGIVNILFLVDSPPPRIQVTMADVAKTITVTARRVEERLQDVPISVTPMSGEKLSSQGFDTLDEYITRVPSVAFERFSEAENTITIRGINAPGGRAATVALYIDDMPVTGPAGFQPTIRSFDVERIEVLRGPQGTLFGEGSLGGTIRTIMNKPVLSEFSGRLEASGLDYTNGDSGYWTNLMVNVPVVEDVFALRFTGMYRDIGGWIDLPDAFGGPIEDHNQTEVMNLRLSSRWIPTDKLIIDAHYIKNTTDLTGQQFALNSDFVSDRLQLEPYSDDWQQGNITIMYSLGWAEFISATSYLDRTGENISDLGALVPVIEDVFGFPEGTVQNMNINIDQDTERFTQEFRLASTTAGPLQWTAGLFYKDGTEFVGVDGWTTPPIDELTGGAVTSLLLRNIEDNFTQIALFGEVYYDFTKRLKGTVGVRWFKDTRDSTLTVNGVFFGLFEPVTSPTTEGDYTEVTPKFSLAYHLSDDAMIYGSAAKGFRSGGVNAFPAPPPLDADVFEPDTLWSYEAGAKTTSLNGRLIVNGALFYSDWSDVQTVVASVIPGFGATINGGSAHVSGVELELTALLAKHLQAGVAGSYIFEAEYDDTAPGSTAGDPLPGVPDSNLNLSLAYAPPLSQKYSLDVVANYNRVGEAYVFPGNPVTTPAYEIVDLNVGLKARTWSIGLFVHNALDEFVLYRDDSGFGEGDPPGSGLVGPPRSVGVIFGLNF